MAASQLGNPCKIGCWVRAQVQARNLHSLRPGARCLEPLGLRAFVMLELIVVWAGVVALGSLVLLTIVANWIGTLHDRRK